MKLALALIREDGGTQSRAELLQETISSYAEILRNGQSMDPVVVYYDGTDYWLADGFHRVTAAEEAKLTEIDTDVRQGTLRDAVFYSFGANAHHGLQRTNADKRRVVERMVADPEWAMWSDRQVAEACRVSHTFVADVRRPKVKAASGNVATAGTDSAGAGGNVAAPTRSLPPPSPPVGPPPPVDSGVVTRLDEHLDVASRLEERIERFVGDVRGASPRTRQYLRPALERALRDLTRIVQETAA